MQYLPITLEEEIAMLKKIGVSSFDELVSVIPKSIRLKKKLKIDEKISEFELESLLDTNLNNPHQICFAGSGIYDHYVPKVVDFLSQRSEFYTAYTPYQPEVSQGTLQYLYEFQTMIANLSGMDGANASLYDGGSALAEAISVAINTTGKKKVLLSESINPNYLEIVKSFFQGRRIKIDYLKNYNGIINDQSLNNIDFNQYSCIAVQSPNYFGQIEDLKNISSKISKANCIYIVAADPISLAVLESPGKCGADMYVGEGQTLGNYMNYGGPCLGLLAFNEKLIRKIPGRIVGRTKDKNNKDGFVLTLQTREQHIRRERATSNICTNQGLLALRATIYLSLMGKKGLEKIAKTCLEKSNYLSKQISQLKNYKLLYTKNYFRELIVESKKQSASILKSKLLSKNILVDSLKSDDKDKYLQIAVTEKRTLNEMNYLIKSLKEINK